MKKIVLFLVAALLFTPAATVQAKMMLQPTTEKLTGAPQVKNLNELDKKLLTAFKGMGAIYTEAMNTALVEEFPQVSGLDKLNVEQLSILWQYKEFTAQQQKELNALWESAIALIMPLVTEQITEEQVAQEEKALRENFKQFFAEIGMEGVQDDVDELTLDVELVRYVYTLYTLLNCAQIFNGQGSLSDLETAFISADILEAMGMVLDSPQQDYGHHFTPVDPD